MTDVNWEQNARELARVRDELYVALEVKTERIVALEAALRVSTDDLEMWLGDRDVPTNSEELTWQSLEVQIAANRALLADDSK
jgi:hypothetical protein